MDWIDGTSLAGPWGQTRYTYIQIGVIGIVDWPGDWASNPWSANYMYVHKYLSTRTEISLRAQRSRGFDSQFLRVVNDEELPT